MKTAMLQIFNPIVYIAATCLFISSIRNYQSAIEWRDEYIEELQNENIRLFEENIELRESIKKK